MVDRELEGVPEGNQKKKDFSHEAVCVFLPLSTIATVTSNQTLLSTNALFSDEDNINNSNDL